MIGYKNCHTCIWNVFLLASWLSVWSFSTVTLVKSLIGGQEDLFIYPEGRCYINGKRPWIRLMMGSELTLTCENWIRTPKIHEPKIWGPFCWLDSVKLIWQHKSPGVNGSGLELTTRKMCVTCWRQKKLTIIMLWQSVGTGWPWSLHKVSLICQLDWVAW